jgi:hypothetical protein
MAEGIKEGRAHKLAFEAFNEGLTAALPVEVAKWKEWVDEWERKQHVENEKNSPYEYKETRELLNDWFVRGELTGR